jgi:hypothetical protein
MAFSPLSFCRCGAALGGFLPLLIRHAELVSASITPNKPLPCAEKWTLKQVQGDDAG